MGFLADKILSYSPEVYYKFNEPPTNTPTNLGSGGSSTFTTNNEPLIQTVKGGIQGTGSWRINCGNGVADTTPTRYGRLATATNNATALLVDQDYSIGFWFKTNYTLSNSGVHPSIIYLGQFGGSPTAFVRTIALLIQGGAANSANKGKLSFSTSSAIVSPYRVDDQQWHYAAVVATPRDGNNVKYDYYLDGQFIGTQSPNLNTFGTLVYWAFGSTSTSSTANYNEVTTHELSDTYITSSAKIGATQIAEIWTAGQKGFYKATKTLPTQPIHWYPLDENTSDLLLNYGSLGYEGTQNTINLSGAPGTAFNWIAGEVERGLELTSSYAGYDQQPAWDMTLAYTINYWFKKSAPPASAQNWFYWYLNSGNNIDAPTEAGIQTNGYINFKPAMTYGGGPYTQSEVTTQMNVCDGNWHLITFVRDGATLKSYVDGQLKQTVSDWSLTDPNPSASFQFGAQSTSWDEFQIYNYALSDAQILGLYQSEYPAAAGYPLKYWNGTAWTTPISMKQWNGTAWVTMDGSVYSGTAWVDIV
jgi:hypothetical protein